MYKLRDLREDKDMTQQQIADILGVKLLTYQRYEYEQTQITAKHLNILADFFNVSTDYLLGRTKNSYNINGDNSGVQIVGNNKVGNINNGIDNDTIDKIMEILQSLKK